MSQTPRNWSVSEHDLACIQIKEARCTIQRRLAQKPDAAQTRLLTVAHEHLSSAIDRIVAADRLNQKER